MVSKVILGFVVVFLIGTACYAAGWYRREETLLECQIMQVVTDSPEQNQNSHGIPVPYTVVGYRPQYRAYVLPGVLGKPGEVVRIPHQ